ncbi:MAG: hypothetical protein A2W85_05370 [Bacteroidetes bacterium GWF2_41_31]|nr:MAG: hypothetical protein A2W85_05370 [Bacteroidetes bacterium GWF2_41_31]
MEKIISYTNSATSKMEKVISGLRKKIEDDIVESKNFPGEEIIEITASDIENTFNRVRIIKRYSKKSFNNRLITLLLPIYFLSGILLMLFGVYYKEIKDFIENDREQLAFVLSGFILSLTAGAIYFLRKFRENERRKEIIEKNYENSNRFKPESF